MKWRRTGYRTSAWPLLCFLVFTISIPNSFSLGSDKSLAVSTFGPASHCQSVRPLYFVCSTPAREEINVADNWPVTPLPLQTPHPSLFPTTHSLLNIFWQLYILSQSRVAGPYLPYGQMESDFSFLNQAMFISSRKHFDIHRNLHHLFSIFSQTVLALVIKIARASKAWACQ